MTKLLVSLTDLSNRKLSSIKNAESAAVRINALFVDIYHLGRLFRCTEWNKGCVCVSYMGDGHKYIYDEFFKTVLNIQPADESGYDMNGEYSCIVEQCVECKNILLD